MSALPEEEEVQPLSAWARVIRLAGATGSYIKLEASRASITRKKHEAIDLPTLASRVIRLTVAKEQPLGMLTQSLSDYQQIWEGLSYLTEKHNRSFFAQVLGVMGIKTVARRELERALNVVADTIFSLEKAVRKGYRERRVSGVAAARLQGLTQLSDEERRLILEDAYRLCFSPHAMLHLDAYRRQRLGGVNYGMMVESLSAAMRRNLDSGLSREQYGVYEIGVLRKTCDQLRWAGCADQRLVGGIEHYQRIRHDSFLSRHGLDVLQSEVDKVEHDLAQLQVVLGEGDLTIADVAPAKTEDPEESEVSVREALDEAFLQLSRQCREKRASLEEESNHYATLQNMLKSADDELEKGIEETVVHIRRYIKSRLGVVLIGGLRDHPMLYSIRRQADGTYLFTIVNTGISCVKPHPLQSDPDLVQVYMHWSGLSLGDIIDRGLIRSLLMLRQRAEVGEDGIRAVEQVCHTVSDHFGVSMDMSSAKRSDYHAFEGGIAYPPLAVVKWLESVLPSKLFHKLAFTDML